jgi:hypothetical protein
MARDEYAQRGAHGTMNADGTSRSPEAKPKKMTNGTILTGGILYSRDGL